LTVLLGQAAQGCDLNGDGKVDVGDVQRAINEALGGAPAVDDLNGDGVVNVVDVQMVMEGVSTGSCVDSAIAVRVKTRSR
jgi:hypothetical protein